MLKNLSSHPTARFIFDAIRPFKGFIALQMFISTIWALDTSLRPYIIKVILNTIGKIDPEQADELFLPAFAYVFLTLLMVSSFRLYDWVWLNLRPNLKKNIGLTLMDKMMGHSQGLYQNHFSGNLANKVNDVISGVPDVVRMFIEQIFSFLLALIFAVYTVSMVNYKFAIGMMIWVVSFFLFSILAMKKSKQLATEAAEVRSSVVGLIVDILTNMMSVRLFGGKEREKLSLEKKMQISVAADQQRDWYMMKMNAFQGFSFVAYQAICMWWLVTGLKAGHVTAGDFALILALNISLIEFIWYVVRDLRTFIENLGNIAQGLRIANMPPEVQDKIGAKELSVSHGKIIYKNIQFAYKDNHPLFENFSLTIAPGQKVGLVGYSGGGKTTFVNLLLRLFDVKDGQITIDDQNIANVSQESLRNHIAMIPQDPSLFHRTLTENIQYGKEASLAEVIEAAKKAHADEFIELLPNKYESLIGERGIKLSGGQRQRVAIARAILKNAPILILDEATSQLDSMTEHVIQKSLWELMQGKTTIVIAHRLSTLLYMDRILVFDRGRIVEDGSHSDLLAKNGVYKTLWDAQVGGFIPRHTPEMTN